MRADLGLFGHEGGIDVVDRGAAGGDEFAGVGEDFQTADAADGFIGIGEMVADVTFADGTEKGISDGVGQNIGVGVTLQTAMVRNEDATENEGASFAKAVDVVTEAGGDHAEVFSVQFSVFDQLGTKEAKSARPLVAVMRNLLGLSGWGWRSTVPPAAGTRRRPAAMSHKLMVPSR